MSSTLSDLKDKLQKMNLGPASPGTIPAPLMDVSGICAGCRCGWLCCDCIIGCLACKERLRNCFCKWNNCLGVNLPCISCETLLQSCKCSEKWRCKWCVVSLAKCKRGGCVKKLPDRDSPEALPYVDIFNKEDGPDDDAIPFTLVKVHTPAVAVVQGASSLKSANCLGVMKTSATLSNGSGAKSADLDRSLVESGVSSLGSSDGLESFEGV